MDTPGFATLSVRDGRKVDCNRTFGLLPIAVPADRATPVDEELRRYDEYMEHVRGLAPKTRSMALRVVGRLLTVRFGEGAVDVAAIKPEHVRRFFAGQAAL